MIKAGLLYFIGNIFDKAVAFITIPIFTYLLSTSEYGVVSTYLSWVSVVSVVITLSLGNSIRTACVDFKDDIDGYLSSIFMLGTISAGIMIAIAGGVALFLGEQISIKMILLCCIDSYALSVLGTIKWRYTMDMDYLKRTALQCIPNILILVISIGLIMMMKSDLYRGRIYAYIIVDAGICAVYLGYYFIKGKKFINIRYWKYALGFSLPLIFHSLSNVILAQSDRMMLTYFCGSSETGIYSIAYQFGLVPLVFATTMENTWIPWFTEKMEQGKKEEINRMAEKYILLVCVFCIGIMLVAPEVLKIMTQPEYHRSVNVIPPVIVATFLMYLSGMSINLEYYKKRTRGIASNTIVAAVVNIVLNIILIPQYGAIAAAYTTVAAYGVSFVMHVFCAKKLEPDLFRVKMYLGPVLITVFAVIVTVVLNDSPMIRWGMGIVLGICFLGLLRRFFKKSS